MGNVPAILDKQVVQTNPLIEARKYMNLSEMRLFILGLQGVKPHIKDDTVYDVEFHETWVSPTELKSLFANNDGSVNNMKRHIKNAFDGKIELSDGYGGYMLYHIYNKMHYVQDKGLLIKFDDEMKPYILDIVGKAYTTYSIKTMFPLSSEYAWRLLESLLEYQGYFKKGKKKVYCELSLDEVRFRLNVPEGQYAGRMSNFRSRVLDLPIKDINEKTEYKVWYDVMKTGRKVTGFRFWLEKKQEEKQITAKTDTKISVSGVLRDRADKTFRGTIDFIKGCKTATGDEREDVLLMDEGVHNNTVPLILCAEEDVEGAHGASIGKISEEVLNYFASRGIAEDDVTELMAKSRIDAVAGRIPDAVTRDLLLSEE